MKLRDKNYELWIKGCLVAFLTIIFTSFPLSLAHAADSTPSADIKAKLEELKKQIASKAAKLKQEVTSKLKDRAYIGKVKSRSETSITLATKNGPKIVNINQDTIFESNVKNLPDGRQGKKYSSKTITEEDYLATLGDVDETGVLTAKKVILLLPPPSQTKTFLWGQIISKSDKLVTLKDKDGKNIAVSLPTSFTVKALDYVILTGSKGENDIFDAEFVYIIPQGSVIKPKKTASPSAQPTKPSKTASPSAKPKSTPKPTSR